MVNDVRHKWIQEFERRARPWLQEIFEKELDNTPREITAQLERLRQVERKLLRKDRN
jgi:hypothetical protein